MHVFNIIYKYKLKKFSKYLHKKLLNSSLKIGTVESCTGGLILSSMVQFPGSSSYLDSGVVTYSNESKVALSGVLSKTLKNYGAVSENIAGEMSSGFAKRRNLDGVMSVTGIAGPTGGSSGKPVGTVCIGTFFKGECRVESYHFKGNRDGIRLLSAISAIKQFIKLIEN